MSGLTTTEVKLINGLLAEQKNRIMEDVSKNHLDLKEDIRSLSSSVNMLAGIASKAKELAEKTHASIEGNGAIGLKTQVRQCNDAIKDLVSRFDTAEKEALKEKIKDAECNEELKEKKYSRRAEDKRAKVKNILTLAGVIVVVIGDIVIKLFLSGGATP